MAHMPHLQGQGAEQVAREAGGEARPASSSGVARRKQRQRVLEEQTKQQLQLLLGFQAVSHKPQTGADGKKRRSRKTIDVDDLYRAAIKRVREILARERGEGEEEPEGSGSAQQAAVSEGDGSVWRRVRSGMLKSRVMGTLLLRREDMVVVESSEAMCLFSSYEPIKGYRGHSLEFNVHPHEAEGLVAMVRGCKPGSEGSTTSVRLLRSCYEEASKCLLTQYVRKELKVSHVSADGESVLLTCSLSPADTAPLATNLSFWKEWFQNSALWARGHFSFRSAKGRLTECVPWALNRGWEAAEDNLACQTVAETVVQRMWSKGMVISDSVAQQIESAVRFYFWVTSDHLQRPRMQLAYRMSLGGYHTSWRWCLSYSPSGEKHSMVPLPGAGAFFHMASVLLPEEGEPLRPTILDIGLAKGDAAMAMEGVNFFQFQQNEATQVGHLRAGPDSSLSLLRYFLRQEGAQPELEHDMELMSKKNKYMFRMPLTLGSDHEPM